MNSSYKKKLGLLVW